ncbi:hypothetical protein CLOSTMETH_03723 [[Clostridium] methylpentosum DSM 5476]|uniref:Uncharacterized protein n=1 Tax=[Clostridium] methylpentosum DSM 5476 TaxID=537013 RepID=C0EIM8_9FIRM|nr:hypothetical protein CLOSTMETH_03723 [[Clostridium] methylpentosum DSM 5476]
MGSTQAIGLAGGGSLLALASSIERIEPLSTSFYINLMRIEKNAVYGQQSK